MSACVLDDAGHDDAPDFNRLAVGGHDVGKVGVCRDQEETVGTSVKGLASEIAIDHGNHDVSAFGLDRPIHQHDRAIQDARVSHPQAAHAQHERGLRVPDELVHQVDVFDLVVFCWRRESGLHAGRESVDQERAGRQGLRSGKLVHGAEITV